jgi:hypothetical protein
VTARSARTLAAYGALVRRAGALMAALAAGGAALAGCGSPGRAAAAPVPVPVPLPLATALAAGPATWAVVPMGTAAPGPGQLWEVFARPAGGTRWTLATPPAVGTSGAIALAAGTGGTLVAGIRPSQALRFSPVTSTADGGRTWVPGGPAPALAPVPDALAAAPRGRALIALAARRGGRAAAWLARAGPSGPWTALGTAAALSATGAGRACGVTQLTAAAFAPDGRPVLGAACRRPGTAGIFAERGGTWRAAGPRLGAAGRPGPVRVLRLARAGGRLAALLQAGTGRAAVLIAAWTSGGPPAGPAAPPGPLAWTVSAPLPVRGAAVTASSLGGNGAVAVGLGGRRAAWLAGPGAAWRPLPALPRAPHVTLALPAGGGVLALTASGSVLTAWRLPPGAGRWAATQRTAVDLAGAPG